MLLFVASLGSSKMMHIIIVTYLILLKWIAESVSLLFWSECQVWKFPRTVPFDIYVGARCAKIFLLCVMMRAEKLEKVGKKIDHCHQYQPLIIYWTVTLLLYIFMIRHYFTFSAVWSHMTQVQVWCLKHYFRAIFVDAFWKGPLTPEIFTSTILLSFLSNLWVTSYRVIPNCSYKVIKHQILWCRKYMKIRIFIWSF